MSNGDSEGRNETELERADRRLTELLGELRVALPGVQVLFAFLLVVPFSARFGEVSSFQEKMYFVSLICATLASMCLIAPSMHHRIEFRQGDKHHIVEVANRLTIAGLTLLALGMVCVLILITDFLFGTVTTVITAGVVAIGFVILWYAMPILRLRKIGGEIAGG
jgi:hypothetical protein